MKIKFDEVISGHGSCLESTFKVPEGTVIVMLAPPGAMITDRLGGYVETYAKSGLEFPLPVCIRKPDPATAAGKRERMGARLAENDTGYPKIFSAGDTMPDLIIHPADGLTIRRTLDAKAAHSYGFFHATRSSGELASRPTLVIADTKLSDQVVPHMGNVIVSACSYNPDLSYGDHTMDLDDRLLTVAPGPSYLSL
jgi:hypothetical protein